MATESEEAQALRWRIVICALIVFFAIVVLMVGIHLYPRWYLVQLRLRHHQIEVRRRRRRTLPGVVSFADSVLPGTAVERRLELAVLNSLPVFLYTPTAEQPECVVCLSEFEEKETVRLLPKCNHSFHIECLDMWFQSHSTCPLCRSPVEKVACRSDLLNEGGTQSQPSYFAIYELLPPSR